MDTFAQRHPAHHSRPASATASGTAPACLPHTEAIRAEQIRLLYANAPAGFVATGLNAGLLALTQWPVIPPPVILAWLAYMLALTGLRAVVVWRFQRVAPAPPAIDPWGTLFGLGTGLAGLGWGGAGVVLFPSTSMPHQVFLTFVVGGMIAGAIGLLAARMPVFLSFACPAALPVIVHWLAQGDRLATTMGGMATLFTLVSIVTACKLHHSILSAVHLRFDNRDLVASVMAEKERVEDLNTHLTAEIAERQRAEEALRTAHEALEERVCERTATLTTTLRQLQAEMHERQHAEEAVRQLNAALEHRIQERTAALRQEMEERQRLERDAQRVQHFALLGRLAAGVAHEIRNPLGAVFLQVELLVEELRAPSLDSAAAVGETLADIKSNLARLEDLVQDYLTLVRVPTLQREVQDLGDAVQAWGTEMQREVAARGVTLQMQGLAELGRAAFHASTLRRALLNLVQNAADAMPQGGTVTLAGHGTATLVQLRVQDMGSGIPAERLGQIFEPLYTTKAGGTGLGLYIVQEIVAAHEGTVTVASVSGQGTTFTLTLPRMPSDASTAGASPSDPAPPGVTRLL
jgi:signal transduction histidine kinase